MAEGEPMTQLDLLTAREHRMADTSLEAYQRVAATLPQKEIAVFKALWSTLDEDMTGGELAEFMGWPVTSVRPRLTALCDRGWIEKRPIRQSRVNELRCHPYAPVVPLAALERIKDG
jgi:DNA-binding MarR family transcriptional regulator